MFWTKMRKTTGLLVTLFLVIGGGGALVGTSQGGGESASREVIVARPLARAVADEEDFTGVTVVDSTEVRSRLAGILGQVHFKDGAEVKKGQLLAEIDPRPFQAELDKAEADIRQSEVAVLQATKNFESLERGSAKKRQAGAELEAAKASLTAAKEMREMAKANLALTRLAAPIDGRAYVRSAPGKAVRAEEAVAIIMAPGPAHVDFDAPLRLLPIIGEAKDRSGLPVAVGLTGDKGLPRRGTVSLVGARVDAETGTLRLRATIPNDGIKPGEAARVRLATGKPYRALLVPPGALRGEKSGNYLIVVSDKNEVERRRVEVGPSQDGLRAVKAGLRADEWVVLDSSFGANPGAPVAPRKVSLLPEEAGKSRARGDFTMLNSLEYQVPVKPNDHIYFVPFVDSGTVAPRGEIKDSGAKTTFLKDDRLIMNLPLAHASASDAGRVAKIVYRDRLAPKGRLVISVDLATNSLSVEGTTEQVLEVVKLVAGLEELARRNPKSDALRWLDELYDLQARQEAPPAPRHGPGPRLGVTVDPLPSALVAQLNLPAGIGLLVTDVAAGSPAAKVGIQANDVLVKIDGAQIPADVGDFVKLIANLKSNTPMDVVVVRKGKRETLGAVRLAEGTAPNERQHRVNEIQSRIDALEADVATMKDRVAWSERMFKKGYLSARQVEADRQALEKLKADLERARKELQSLSPKDKESLERWLKSRE